LNVKKKKKPGHRGIRVLLAAFLGGAPACEEAAPEAAEQEVSQRPDARLEVYALTPSTPTAEGLSYLQALASLHRRVEAASEPPRKMELLREGLVLPVPAGLEEARVLHLELAAGLCETALEVGHEPGADPLRKLLDPAVPVPLDLVTARALICLGDTALRSGEDALAAGSYARAIRLMSLLRQELEP
jgi:hypothetical protein